MALTIPIPIRGLTNSCYGTTTTTTTTHKVITKPSSSSAATVPIGGTSSSIRANLPHNKRNKGVIPALINCSPRTTTDEIGSGFALEMTVVELERLFGEGDHPHPPWQFSGPYSPSHSIGYPGGRPVRVAYQGVRGSYCQEAALKAFSSISTDSFFSACNHMEDAFQALQDRSAQRAIIPVENSIDGTIGRNLDLLLRHRDVSIVGELILPVNHCLLALPGTSASQLRRVVSHPQALSHCKSKLIQRLDDGNLEVEEVPNSAEAARYVSENGISDTAVIGSKIAAKEFDLQILEQNMQEDGYGNFNRFLQLGLTSTEESICLQEEDDEEEGQSSISRRYDRHHINSGGGGGGGGGGKRKKEKTTIAFSLEKGVSDLFRALWIFDRENISVTRVEHRPNRSNPVNLEGEKGEKHHHHHHRYFDYVFILDLEWEGNVSSSDPQSTPPRRRRRQQQRLKTALSRLQDISGFTRVLGTYTCDLISS